MAIRINNNTITGNIYYNDVQVEKVYINNNLVWEALPENNITLKIYRRVWNGINQFRIYLEAEHYVKDHIAVNVQYNTSGASTTVTIYRTDKYGMIDRTGVTDWRNGYANVALITGVSPESDGTYRYTYTPSGVISDEWERLDRVSSYLKATVTQYYYPPSVPVTKSYTLKVESEYPVENHPVTAYLNLGPALPSVEVTLRNTKSVTISETGKEATQCEWNYIDSPPYGEAGFYYTQGPTTFEVIDNR